MALLNRKKEEIKTSKPEIQTPSVPEPELRPVGTEAEPGRESEKVQEAQPAQEQDQPSPAQAPSSQPIVSRQGPALGEKSEELQQIERILEEDLGEAFQQMDVKHQHMFKVAGEDTARQVENLLGQVKVKTQKIFELIKNWLIKIPGVSKWFVVQESKIKTDKLIKLKDKS